ncbi:MAG: hypothetical protein MHMPM18_000085 [Marteilia pararefringens]
MNQAILIDKEKWLDIIPKYYGSGERFVDERERMVDCILIEDLISSSSLTTSYFDFKMGRVNRLPTERDAEFIKNKYPLRYVNGFSFDGMRLCAHGGDGREELTKKQARQLDTAAIEAQMKRFVQETTSSLTDAQSVCLDIIESLRSMASIIGDRKNPFRFFSTSLFVVLDNSTVPYSRDKCLRVKLIDFERSFIYIGNDCLQSNISDKVESDHQNLDNKGDENVLFGILRIISIFEKIHQILL